MTVKAVMEDKISELVDGENSRGIIDRIILVCNPHNSLFCHFDKPNTKILIAGVAIAEEAQGKIIFFGNQRLAILDELVWC